MESEKKSEKKVMEYIATDGERQHLDDISAEIVRLIHTRDGMLTMLGKLRGFSASCHTQYTPGSILKFLEEKAE